MAVVGESVTRAGSAAAPSRLAALDATRALAVIGMISVNVGPSTGSDVADVLHRLPLGRASLLFVVLAGLGTSLATRRAGQRESGMPWGLILWRSGLLLAGGLTLQRLDHGVSVILPTYAVLFLLALPLSRVPERAVAALAAGATVLGPIAWIGLQQHRGADYGQTPAVAGDPPLEVVHAIFLSGPYPVITWAGPFLLGMWLGRRDLAHPALQRRLVVVGAAAAVGGRALSAGLVQLVGAPGDTVGFDRLVTAVGHSQMPLWLVSGMGSAVLVLGVMLRAGEAPRTWLWPLVLTGQLALTIYVGHLVVPRRTRAA